MPATRHERQGCFRVRPGLSGQAYRAPPLTLNQNWADPHSGSMFSNGQALSDSPFSQCGRIESWNEYLAFWT